MKPRRSPRTLALPTAGIDLAVAADLVGAEYRSFMANSASDAEPGDAKAFMARHAAARAALAHVEHLHRLAQLLAEGRARTNIAAPLIAMARHAIAQTTDREEEPEADDLSGEE